MLVTVQLNTGRIRLASDRRAEVRAPRPTSPPGTRSAMSSRVRAPSALVNSLDLCVPSRTAARRWRGSAMSVPSDANMPDTMFPAAARSDSPRTEIGAMAISGSAGSSPFSSR